MAERIVQMTGGAMPAMAEGYPVLEGSWVKGAAIPESAGIKAINNFGMSAKVGQKVYVFSADSANTYIYDIVEDCWTAAERMPTPRANIGCVVAGDKVYCMGGRIRDMGSSSWVDSVALEIFDTTSNSWLTGAELPEACYSMACLLWEGDILCFGGVRRGEVSSNTLKYDIEKDAWIELEQAPTVKLGNYAHVLLDNRVYWVNAKEQNNFEIFDLEEDRWFTGPDVPTARHIQSIMAAQDGKVYCIAGITAAVEYYDTKARLWYTAAPKPTGNDFAALLQRGGKFYCVGGSQGSVFERYDPASDTWQVGENVPNPTFSYCPVFLEGNRIVCVGNERNIEVDIFQLEGKEEHLVRVQYQVENGDTLRGDDLRIVEEGERFSVTAPAVDGHTLMGYRLDGGELKGGRTVELEAVSSGHVILFVYRSKSDDGNGGDEGNGGDGSNGGCDCDSSGQDCCKCCEKYTVKFTTAVTACSEEAAVRMAKKLRNQ